MTLNVRIVCPSNDDALWEAYLACRYDCLYAPFNLPRTCTTSELDSPRDRAGILHRASVMDGRVVATARLDIQLDHANGPSAQLRYFSVHPDVRGQGVGQALLRHVEREGREAGCKRLWMEARVAALNFYLREGYTDFGEGPMKWGVIPHRLLHKPL